MDSFSRDFIPIYTIIIIVIIIIIIREDKYLI